MAARGCRPIIRLAAKAPRLRGPLSSNVRRRKGSKLPSSRWKKNIIAHRGTPGDLGTFAERFITGRLAGFDKDLRICLTGVPSATRPGKTHAYFPALAACCATLEYLTALHRGSTHGIGWQQVRDFALEYLPQPDYNEETIRVLFDAIRHPVAHRGIASGVWVDRTNGPNNGRRLVWRVSADARRPACHVDAEPGKLTQDPPWPTVYTHRVHVHLRSLWIDLRRGGEQLATDIRSSEALLQHFIACMRQMYPQ